MGRSTTVFTENRLFLKIVDILLFRPVLLEILSRHQTSDGVVDIVIRQIFFIDESN